MSSLLHKEHEQHPTRFRSAIFPAAGAPLELVEVEYRPPAKGRVTLKVDACFLSMNDAIGALGMRKGHDKFPVSPGQVVVGRIVEVGTGAREGGPGAGMLASVMGKLNIGGAGEQEETEGHELHHKFKPGELVIGSVTHQGLGEYCTTHATSTCAVFRYMPVYEQAVTAVFGGRVLAIWERYKWDVERKTEEELSVAREKCQAHLGLGCSGVVVIYGSGGYASLAYHLLNADSPDERIVIVSPSTKHTHQDYDVPSNDFLQYGKARLEDELRRVGGVKLVICVDQPEAGFPELLDAMCDGSEISLVNVGGNGLLHLPVGNLIGRSLAVRGPPALLAQTMHRALRLCEQHDLHRHVAVRKFTFDVEGVRQCYDATLRSNEDFSANFVVFGAGTEAVPVPA